MNQVVQNLPTFCDRGLLQRALTHRSFVNEATDKTKDNERLEFLGDAILTFLCGEFLYKKYPTKTEGELTALRSTLVDAKQLADFARMINLGEHLHLGKGTERDGGRDNPRILSSTFEALMGAYFLDQDSNIEAVQKYVIPFFESVVITFEKLQTESTINYKSRFQEWALAEHGENPSYVLTAATGPDHAKTFITEVQVRGQCYGRGKGHKKQDAEKDAARQALDRLGLL